MIRLFRLAVLVLFIQGKTQEHITEGSVDLVLGLLLPVIGGGIANIRMIAVRIDGQGPIGMFYSLAILVCV